jgi:hypothetical protein
MIANNKTYAAILQEKIAHGKAEIARYNAEKRELKLGSAVVGPAGWVLDNQQGKYGAIVGATSWELQMNTYNIVGRYIDYSTMCLQLSLVMGTVSIVINAPLLKKIFFCAMLFVGVIGIILGIFGFVKTADLKYN